MKENHINFTTQEKFYISWDIKFTKDMMTFLIKYLRYGKYEGWNKLTYQDWFDIAQGVKDTQLTSKEFIGCHFSATKIIREFLKWYFMCEEPDRIKITDYDCDSSIFKAKFEKKI